MKEIYDVDNYRSAEKIATEINTIKEKTFQTVIMSSIEIGKKLCEAKELVNFGEWGDWLKEKVNYSQDTANNLMRIYREYGNDQLDIFSNSETFQKLGYSQAVTLFAIPKEDRAEFIEQNEVDENTTIRELKEEVEKWKAKNKELEDELTEKTNQIDELAEGEVAAEIKAELNKAKEKAAKAEDEKKKADKALADIKKQMKEAEDKIKKAESEKNDLISQIDEVKKKAAEEVESKSKENLEKLIKEKEEAEKRAQELEQKTKALASGDIQKSLALIEMFQRTFSDITEILNKLEDEQREKIKAGLRKLLNNMNERI